MNNMEAEGRERIGLLGGTFNPIHRGHVRAAGLVRDRFGLDRVLFIPSHISPHKPAENLASAEHRLEMVRLAVSGRRGFTASAIEIEAGGCSYSILTLEKIRALHPAADLYFILGIDAFLEIDTWKEYQRVLDGCRFIVISRPGWDLASARDVLGPEFRPRICVLRDPAASPTEAAGCTVYLLELETIDVSSSEIRERIREGRSIAELVDPGVAKYLKEKGLYKQNHE